MKGTRKTNKLLKFFIGLAIFSCFTSKAQQLDIAKYLALAKNDTIYPSPEQINMLQAIIPKDVFHPAPSIADRTYWNAIALSESGKNYLAKAVSELGKKPEVPISDSIYRRANKEGNRGIYKPRYYRTMQRLEHFILAECLENKGQFIQQIEIYIQAIMDMKSWLHPNHDDAKNGVLEGRRVTIDLGARRFGSDLALADVLLGDKLEQELRTKITEQLENRIIDSYLTSSEILDENNKWIKSTSNWNAVCTSGPVFVAMAISKSEEKRIAAIGSALNSMKYYLSGFGSDGYCSEGPGYWNYGFGHYLYLSQILYDYSNGAINLFEADNPEKLVNIGNFPERYQIHKGICAPISDGVSKVSNDGGFAYNMSARHFGARLSPEAKKSKSHDSFSAVYQLIEWNYDKTIPAKKSNNLLEKELPNYTYFDDVGMIISRGKQKNPFSIAIKAGHNAENHNHSDVGTYTIVLGSAIMTGDIGAPSYTAGAFSPDNKARSSWGHPVPILDKTLQSNGRNFSGTITNTKFTTKRDKVVMDIKPAYEIPSVTKLIRTMENNKSGIGSITIKDEFSSSIPITFGTAIMTYASYEIIDDHTLILTTEHQKIKAEISSNGLSFRITDEQVPVKKLREGGTAYRIGVALKKPIAQGAITIKYTPLN